MANPTTNYGFVLPTASDLVTDLPADFDVALQGVDTRLKALQPGTTLGDLAYSSATANTNTRLGIGTNGQVLGVAAGVPAWVTSADQTPLTTKGDLFTFTTVDARLGIGANNTILTADSAEATGMKWAAPAPGGGMTQIATGSLAGATTTISSISSAYKNLVLVLNNVSITGSDEITLQINGLTSGYGWISFRAGTTSNDHSMSGNQIKIPSGNTAAADTNYRSVIEFPNYSTSGPLFCTFSGVFNSSATNTGLQPFMGIGSNSGTGVVSSITLKANWGGAFVFDSGTYTLFGVN